MKYEIDRRRSSHMGQPVHFVVPSCTGHEIRLVGVLQLQDHRHNSAASERPSIPGDLRGKALHPSLGGTCPNRRKVNPHLRQMGRQERHVVTTGDTEEPRGGTQEIDDSC